MLKFACFCLFALSLNSAEPKSTPYVIHRESPGGGFWSNFFFVLVGLDKADREGRIPVVDMERHTTNYNESYPLFNTMNAWEYYFEQPGGISLEDALKMKRSRKSKSVARSFGIRPADESVARKRELIAKYIKIHEAILDDVDDYILPGFHKTVLGVHVRGTDRRQGVFKNHAVTVIPEKFDMRFLQPLKNNLTIP